MSLFVLDTDSFSLLHFGHAQIIARALAVQRLAATIVTVEESLTGWYTRLRQAKTPEKLAVAYQGLHKVTKTLQGFTVLPYSESAIRNQMTLRQQFRHRGKLDLAIAAIALEFNATLVTCNRGDFEDIPGLRVEDWSQP